MDRLIEIKTTSELTISVALSIDRSFLRSFVRPFIRPSVCPYSKTCGHPAMILSIQSSPVGIFRVSHRSPKHFLHFLFFFLHPTSIYFNFQATCVTIGSRVWQSSNKTVPDDECRRISQSRGNNVTRGCRPGCPKATDRFRSVRSIERYAADHTCARVCLHLPASPPLPTTALPSLSSGTPWNRRGIGRQKVGMSYK